jgi:hypothetical protein
MAILCPQCGEIHFETTTSPAPTHCRRCESDLNGVAGYAPLLATDAAAAAPPRTRTGAAWVVAGLVLLGVAGGCWWLGVDRYTSAKKTTATVVSARASAADGGGPSKGQTRGTVTATYTVNGRTYHQYPGVRGQGAAFDVYYLPGDPAGASEERPFAFLLAAAVLTKVGLIVLLRGVFQFSVARARESDYRRVMRAAA